MTSSARIGSERPPLRVIILTGAAIAFALIFAALGIWQVQRLAWKLDLIARVDARLAAAPVPAPGPSEWSALNRADAEYRRVRVTGHFLEDRETAVLAVTDLGRGYWIVTPLVSAQGYTILVNRGFVPSEYRAPETRPLGLPPGEVEVAGLLRFSEPGGGFLRVNDPQTDRWFSRDVAAIAAARNLGETAPYFIDADAAPNPGGWPLGGLTQVSFRNTHLVYALTWFALTAMSLAAGWYVVHDWQRRRAGKQEDASDTVA